jgi:type II secretory pathway pseudopilin PulG
VEIMLVVVIIGIASAVALPTFAKSYRGAKLRTSVRMVLAMHRNAQSKAVLGQEYTALLFDIRKGTVELVEQSGAKKMQDSFFGEIGGGGSGMGSVMSGSDFAGGGGGGANGDGDGDAVSSFALRKLEDTVSFESFRGGKEIDELFYVSYYPSGRCEGYTVTLADGEGRRRSVTVDSVTGKAKVKDG